MVRFTNKIREEIIKKNALRDNDGKKVYTQKELANQYNTHVYQINVVSRGFISWNDYKKFKAKQNGFKSCNDYNNYLYKNKGFSSFYGQPTTATIATIARIQ